jgi:hypothetical protein
MSTIFLVAAAAGALACPLMSLLRVRRGRPVGCVAAERAQQSSGADLRARQARLAESVRQIGADGSESP